MSLFNESFFTQDYDQEMLDFVESNYKVDKSIKGWSKLDLALGYSYRDEDFYLLFHNSTGDNLLTKDEFKQKIGMPTEEITMENETVQKQATFGKKDLVDGMFVKCRNGNVFMKLGNTLNSLTGYLELNVYTDTLLDGESEDDWDIVEVYQTKGKECSLARMVEKGEGLVSIWKRPSEKTPSQLKLKDLQQKMETLHEEMIMLQKSIEEEE